MLSTQNAFCIFVLATQFASPPLVAQAQPTPPFTKTTIVGCTGNPSADGGALQAALARAEGGARWLIRLEPCIYQVSAAIVMKDLVDIEGSGRGVTTILLNASFSNLAAAICPSLDHTAELRDLSIQQTSTRMSVGVLLGPGCRLSRVDVMAQGSQGASGIVVQGGIIPAVIADVQVVARATQPNRSATGIEIQGGGSLRQVSVNLDGPATKNTGIVAGGQTELENGKIRIVSSLIGIGIQVSSGAKIRHSQVSVSGSQAFALNKTADGVVEVTDSTFIASGINYGYGARVLSTPGVLSIERSTFGGTGSVAGSSIAKLSSTTVRVALSQLAGSIINSGGGSLTCVGAYNQSFRLLNTVCQ